MNKKFKITDEQNIEREANLITIFENEGKEYAVYSLDNKNGTVDILASYVVKDAEGFDQLVDITNPIDKEKISNFIKSLVA